MGSIVSGLTDAIGITDSGAPERIAKNIPKKSFGFKGSTLTNNGVNLSKDITDLKEEGRGFSESSLDGIKKAKEDVIGDRDTFIQRRTMGLRAGLEAQKKGLDTRLGQQGVEGAFSEQSKEQFKVSAEQKIAQGESVAFDELMSLEGNFDQIEGGAIAALAKLDMNDFAQKMQAAGMSESLVESLRQIQLGKAGEKAKDNASTQALAGNVIMGLAMFSSRTFKHSMKSLDNKEILESMMELDVESWKYNGEEERHIGCYAEDFNDRFGEAGDKTISVVSIIGVLMASIQAQQEQLKELKGEVYGRA